MPSYGKQFIKFFEKSSSPDFKKLSQRINIVSSADEGIHMSRGMFLKKIYFLNSRNKYGFTSMTKIY